MKVIPHPKTLIEKEKEILERERHFQINKMILDQKERNIKSLYRRLSMISLVSFVGGFIVGSLLFSIV
jgi:hypothetical protein